VRDEIRAAFGLPLLDETMPALFGQYRDKHTHKWARTIASYDAFVFVTPEYNRSVPASLKNAIDFLYNEWSNKVAGSSAMALRTASAPSSTCGPRWQR